MKRFAVLNAALSVTLYASALAAPNPERLRGSIVAINGSGFTLHTAAGSDMPIKLSGDTKFLRVEKASLATIEKGTHIGAATKDYGALLVALEVTIIPASMKGEGSGHYAWDEIADTTVVGRVRAGTKMTNGNGNGNGAVAAGGAAATAPKARVTASKMTNGDVAAAVSDNGTLRMRVTYQGGEQTILVPPSAPIVTFQPGSVADVTMGANVFVMAAKEGGKVTAETVAVGADGLKPPM